MVHQDELRFSVLIGGRYKSGEVRILPIASAPLGRRDRSVHPGGVTGFSIRMPSLWCGGPLIQRCPPPICNGLRLQSCARSEGSPHATHNRRRTTTRSCQPCQPRPICNGLRNAASHASPWKKTMQPRSNRVRREPAASRSIDAASTVSKNGQALATNANMGSKTVLILMSC